MCIHSEAMMSFSILRTCCLDFIKALSHWCIFHRSKAELVVTTWEKQFHSAQMVQKVPLLYLANDILQNSKRKGNEFVTEFWKVLPGALKVISEEGDDHGKNVVSRLVSQSSILCETGHTSTGDLTFNPLLFFFFIILLACSLLALELICESCAPKSKNL